MRNIMSDAGLAGPLPELLFPFVLLATALIHLFNVVVNFYFWTALFFRSVSVVVSLFYFYLLAVVALSPLPTLSYTLFYIVTAAPLVVLFSSLLVSLLFWFSWLAPWLVSDVVIERVTWEVWVVRVTIRKHAWLASKADESTGCIRLID